MLHGNENHEKVIGLEDANQATSESAIGNDYFAKLAPPFGLDLSRAALTVLPYRIWAQRRWSIVD